MKNPNFLISILLIPAFMAAPTARAQHVPVNPPSIRADLSGSWYNPAQSGHGLMVEILDNQRVVLAWYTYDASGNPSHEVLTRSGERRSALDPDDFSSGFGVWSGTSFAAPVLAGELAAALVNKYLSGDQDLSTAAAVARMRLLLDGLERRELR